MALVGQQQLEGIEDDLIPLTSAIVAEAEKHDGKVKSLDIAMNGYIVPQVMMDQWKGYKERWDTWYAELNDAWFINNWKWRDNLIGLREEFHAFVKRLEGIGVDPGVVNYRDDQIQTDSDKPPEPSFLERIQTIAKYGVIIAVIGGGVYLVANAMGGLKAIKRLL